jgi:hypothetical protein
VHKLGTQGAKQHPIQNIQVRTDTRNEEIQTMAMETTIHEDEALRTIGPDATAAFDSSASNPAEYASSENLSAAEEDLDEEEDDDLDEEDEEDEDEDEDEDDDEEDEEEE